MRRDLHHITIAGKPACCRGEDPVGLQDRAHALRIGLVCSGPLEKVAPLVTLYREHYEDVALVPGGCPVAYEPLYED